MLRVIIAFIILVLAFIYILGGASGFFEYDLFSLFKKDKWTGFFYEKKDNIDFLKSEVYSDIEDCRSWASNKSKELNLIVGTYRYECGKNCEFSRDSSAHTCEEISM